MAMKQQIRFCESFDGTRIAYALTGQGPPLVRAPHWFTHLEHDWRNPAMIPWVEDLSRRYTLARFDQRGTGLSDRDVADISFDAHLRDLETVVEAAGLKRFALLGLSQGAAYAITYAARHPERVTHLIICGGLGRGMSRRGLPPDKDHIDTLVKLIEMGWGSDDASFRQVFTTQFMPDAGPEAIRAFNTHMPLTTSAHTAARIFRMHSTIDVLERASGVKCPTLVLHARGDRRIPFEEGRIIAKLIAGSRFIALETNNHLMMQDEPAWREFLAATAEFYPPGPAARVASAFSKLTAREAEILERIAQGLDNNQIAAHLELSEKTVRNHITHIFDKIEVQNRPQAIVLARQRGLGQQSRDS
jgi:pimeloyl-ACP methyl ester carboxylesterase/DNA-binding CsgD family transcriptional regulator